MAKRILVPVGPSESADAGIPLVAELARSTGATVRLLTVYPVPRLEAGRGGVPYADREIERLQRAGLRRLAPLAARLDGVPVEMIVRFGKPVEEILIECEAFGADLIALGSVEEDWRPRFLGLGVADRVFRRAAVPVLLLRAPSLAVAA
ncbi:MAG TPA: universal stress protein [Methylomirabilota bacterium]|nr:universal stress protein [Methylomirabilota bacterium]